MSRAELILTNDHTRQRAVKWVMTSPSGTRLTFKEPKRSIPQNDRMWACLTEIARQLPWHGVRLSPDDWKLLFLSALKQEMRLVPNLDGTGFVNLGRSSSDLSKGEFGDLLELINSFAAQHNVTLFDGRDSDGVNSALGDGGAKQSPARTDDPPVLNQEPSR